jgi:hypothetical protein
MGGMRWKYRILLSAIGSLLALAEVGCGSGGATGDGGGSGGGSGGGAGVTFGGRGGLGTGGRGGVSGGLGGMQPALGQRLFTGVSFLLFDGPSCTHEPDATGDRWCAFLAQSTINLGAFDLWVANVTKALAPGSSVQCGGTSNRDCLRLTAAVFGDEIHTTQFTGDTLIYFDATGTGYGWRPGMLNGKRLALANQDFDVHSCQASVRGNAVLCLRSPFDQPDPTQFRSELLVGRLDAPGDDALQPVANVLLASESDTGDLAHFNFDFSPDGQYVAWSAPAVAGGPEILTVQRVGDAASRRQVASGVSAWTFTADGSRWIWLSGFNYDSSEPMGNLQAAPFQDGSAATMLSPAVTDYFLTPGGGVVVMTGVSSITGAGEMRAIADPVRAPGTSISLDTGVLGAINATRGGHIIYVKTATGFGTSVLVDLHAKKLDGTGACRMSGRTESPTATFPFPGGGAALWARFTNLDDPIDVALNVELKVTELESCRSSVVASGDLGNMLPAGDDGVVYTETILEPTFADFFLGTLKLKRFTPGYQLSAEAPTAVQGSVNLDSYTVLQAPTRAVLFAVTTGAPAADGIFLYRWPPAAPAPAASDAGTD